MSISIQVNNGKVVKSKQTDTFSDLFENSGVQGKFLEVDFIFDGNTLQVQKNTKISQFFAGRDQVSIQIVKKGQQTNQFNAVPQPVLNQAPQVPNFAALQPPNFNQPIGGPPPSPFGQPQQPQQQPSGFPQPPKPVIQPTNPPIAQPGPGKFPGFPAPVNFQVQPVLANIPNTRKKISYIPNIDNLQEFKQVDQFTVKICEKGDRVELEDTTNDFKAIFLEENAKPERVQTIKQQLSPTAYIVDPQQVAKLTVGVNNEYTKVIFKNDYRGIAIQWATGLYTLFEFNIQP